MGAKEIFHAILYITTALFILVQAEAIYSKFIAKSKAKENKDIESDKSNESGKRNPRAWEIIWSAIPAAILIALIIFF